MVFTRSEKIACLYSLGCLAESDGPKTYEENRLLGQLISMFDIKLEEVLGGIIQESSIRCNMEIATHTLSVMPYTKKQILEDALSKLMELDEVNDKKLGAWWSLQMAFDLPEWQKRKNK